MHALSLWYSMMEVRVVMLVALEVRYCYCLFPYESWWVCQRDALMDNLNEVVNSWVFIRKADFKNNSFYARDIIY